MSTISVPMPAHLEEALENLIRDGRGSNKAELVRRAVAKMVEDEAILAVLQAEQEITLGKGLNLDLRDLVKKIK